MRKFGVIVSSGISKCLQNFLLYVIGISFVLPVCADKHKIVVIADPHVMAEELLINDGTAFQNWLASTKRLTDFSQAIFDQAVTEILAMSPKPELVMIVGDISKDGELLSHLFVKKELDKLRTNGVSTLVIPGNHDWGNRSNAVYFDGDSTRRATRCIRFGNDENCLEQIYADYGFRTYYKDSATVPLAVERESEQSTLTYACEPISGLVVIGIDSGNNGELSESTVDWICRKAKTAINEGKQVIAMMHHPLINHNSRTGGSIYYPSKKQDAEKFGCQIVRNLFSDAGINVLFTGHSHYHDITMDWNEDFTRTIFDVITGTLSWYPCYYRVVTLSEDLKELQISSNRITEAANSLLGIPFDIEAAKAKFTMDTIIDNLYKNLLSAGVSEDVAQKAAPYYALMYLYDSEADETKNPDVPALLTKLNELFENYPSQLDAVNCMLLDISNYGDAYRENQTDDCNLTIRLDGATTINKVYFEVKNESEKWYTLGGLRLYEKPMRKGIYIKNGSKRLIK